MSNWLMGFLMGAVLSNGSKRAVCVDGRLVTYAYVAYGKFAMDLLASIPFFVLVGRRVCVWGAKWGGAGGPWRSGGESGARLSRYGRGAVTSRAVCVTDGHFDGRRNTVSCPGAR